MNRLCSRSFDKLARNFGKKFALAIGIGSQLLLTSCVTNIAVKSTAQIFRNSAPLLENESDVDLAEKSMLGSIKMLEGLALQAPKNEDALLLLTKNYAGYAFIFTENEIIRLANNETELAMQIKRAKTFYSRAKDYGIRLLSLNGRFKKARNKNIDEFKQALRSFGKKDIETLYWAGFAWANHLNFSKDSPEAVIEQPKIKAIMDRVVELDPNYFHSAPLVFMGGFYGSRPEMLGGNFAKSKEFFEKAIVATDGKMLMAKVAYAQFYAVQTQDYSLFKRLLEEVRFADPTELEGQILMNLIAQERARLLMRRINDLFENAPKRSIYRSGAYSQSS